MAISIILLILAGIYPSWKAASLDPVQAIGYQR
jgi:ABC-type lipoprotein release transport system permease subunit